MVVVAKQQQSRLCFCDIRWHEWGQAVRSIMIWWQEEQIHHGSFQVQIWSTKFEAQDLKQRDRHHYDPPSHSAAAIQKVYLLCSLQTTINCKDIWTQNQPSEEARHNSPDVFYGQTTILCARSVIALPIPRRIILWAQPCNNRDSRDTRESYAREDATHNVSPW